MLLFEAWRSLLSGSELDVSRDDGEVDADADAEVGAMAFSRL